MKDSNSNPDGKDKQSGSKPTTNTGTAEKPAKAAGETAGSGPEKVTEPAVDWKPSPKFKTADEAKGKAGATDKNNKGAGGGDSDEYVCNRQIRFGKKGGKLYAVGDPIRLPWEIAQTLLAKGRISPAE